MSATRPARDHRAPSDAALGALFTLLATIPTLAFILTASVAPRLLGAPFMPGTLVTRGLVLGLVLVLFLVGLALVYTRRLNQRDRARAHRAAPP